MLWYCLLDSFRLSFSFTCWPLCGGVIHRNIVVTIHVVRLQGVKHDVAEADNEQGFVVVVV